MKLETHGSKAYLTDDMGRLYVPETLYLNENYTNPHSISDAAKALRTWRRFANAFCIDLATRSLEGRWLTNVETKALIGLVFCPIDEIESMSVRAIKNIASATNEKEASLRPGAVLHNTALKRLIGIAEYLGWFYNKIIEPRMPATSVVTMALRNEVARSTESLKGAIGGTSTLHHHAIRSVPSKRFLEIYREIYLNPENLLKTKNGKVGLNVKRDKAILLLGAEGVRPGGIGNISLSNFKWGGRNSFGHVELENNTAKRTKTLSTATPVQKGAASKQNYNSNIIVNIWPTTAEAIADYIQSERQLVIRRYLRNRSSGFLFLANHGGPIEDRGTIMEVFRRAGRALTDIGLLSKDANDPYLKGEYYDFCSYLLRHSSASLFYSTKIVEKNEDDVHDLMKARYGWSKKSSMPDLYAKRALSDAASITVNDFMESLLTEAKQLQQSNGAQNQNI